MGDSSPIEAKSNRVAQASEGEPSLSESQRGEEKQEKDKSVEKEKKERGKDHWVPRDRDARTYLKKGSQYHPFILSRKGILIGQRKVPLQGRVCGGRVACVVSDGFKERSAESGPRGRGTLLRMARRWRLTHIEKSSLAYALDRARQLILSVSSFSSFEESSCSFTEHVRKVWEFVAWWGPRWNWKESV
ncbi:hypothetical protein TNCV_3075711 [Trichonephila clavipes]|nr:hypothetical protein TNCV_3075711 [Trichonephila clavipes]